jgi:hypothetical protein
LQRGTAPDHASALWRGPWHTVRASIEHCPVGSAPDRNLVLEGHAGLSPLSWPGRDLFSLVAKLRFATPRLRDQDSSATEVCSVQPILPVAGAPSQVSDRDHIQGIAFWFGR